MTPQLAAILVSDLVSSTELRARIGEERADELRRVHDRLVGGAIAARGGEVVKGLGDGVLARFPAAADAVGAAVAIQQAMAVHGRRHRDQVMHLRVGVAVGDVSVEDGDVFGTPVIEASRLCALAEGDRILVADLVRALGHGRGEHEFVALGARQLKGLPNPVEVCEVRWAPAEGDPAEDEFPLPAPLAAADRFGFAGRAAARELLAERWKAASVEGRQIVLVAGEPGIGKTRLAAELARACAADGAAVLLGRCFEDIDVPYAPFAEAMLQAVLHAPSEVLAAHVDAAGGELTRLVPELGRRIDTPAPAKSAPEAERLRLFDAAVDLLARLGDVAPVLLVLEDLHWADPSSVELLLWLARTTRPMRVSVVGTYRDTDVARTHAFGGALAELHRAAGVERIALTGLDPQEVEAFLERAAGETLDPDALAFANVLWAETEGNPFFLEELLVHLVETDVVRRDGERWVGTSLIGDLGVPQGVRDVVGRRLSLLGDEANDALRGASVLGQEFDLSLLGVLVERDPDELLDLLEEPCARGLLHESGVDRYRFPHALIRQTLYEELGPGRRARLHRRAGDALDGRGAPPGEVAHHLIAAGPRADADRTIRAAQDAAAQAEAQLAWEQAAAWYRRALDQGELVDFDDATAASLLCSLGEATNMFDMAAARHPLVDAFELALGAGADDIAVRAAVAYGGWGGPWLEYGDQRGIELLQRALPLVPENEPSRRSRLYAQLAYWHTLDSDSTKPMALSDRALELARASGDAAAIAKAAQSAIASVGNGLDARLHLALADEMVAAAGAAGDDHQVAWAGNERGLALLRNGAVRDAARQLLDVHARATRSGDVSLSRLVGWHLNGIELLAGRLARARQYIETASDGARSRGEELAVLGQRMLLDELTDEMEPDKGTPRAAADQHRMIAVLFPLDARAAAHHGDGDTAAAIIRRWRAETRPFVPAFLRGYIDVQVATMVRHTDDAELAGWLYDDLLPRSGEWTFGGAPLGSIDIWLGAMARLAGRLDEARRHLDAAWGAHVTEGARAWLPVIDLELAKVLLAEGDDGGADRRAASAASVASELGALALVREARAAQAAASRGA